MSRNPSRILGVDTSLRSSGVAVIEGAGQQVRALSFGTIRNKPKDPHSVCLVRIHEQILELIDRFQPDAVAIEGVFFCKNPRTALILGQARGAVLTACALRGIPVREYAPRLVKQSVVGTGRAQKDQVAKMVMRMLNLKEQPSSDAADALAIALTHLHQQHLPEDLRAKPI